MSFVLGIDFGGTKIALATALSGPQVLHRARIDTRAADGATHVVRRSLNAARTLVSSTSAATGGTLEAVGVATFGVVHRDRMRLAPAVPGWDGLPLPSLLSSEFAPAPTRVSNDVKAATAAELRWGALRGVHAGVYLNLGTGLAAGLVLNGQVVEGANGCAGEIGYLLRTPSDAGFLEGHAPLEEYVSGAALARRGAAPAADLFARQSDPYVRLLIDSSLDALAMAVVNLCITIDPQRLVIGGGMMGASPLILPRLRTAVGHAVPFPPEIVAARFVDDAPLYGALALALDPRIA